MKKAALIILVLILLAGIGLALHHYLTTPRQEGIAKLKTVPAEPFSQISESLGEWTSYIREGKPAEVIDLPNEAPDHEKLKYFSIGIGKTQVFAAVQVTTMYDGVAWLDTDMDLRFSDEEKLIGRLSKYTEQKDAFIFGPIAVHGAEHTSALFYLTCYANSWARCYPASYNIGKIRLENQVCKVIAIDGDYDGTFVTLFNPIDYKSDGVFNSDAIYIEPQSIHFKRRHFDPTWLHPLTQYYKAPQRYYRIEITNQAKTLTMTPAEPVFGKFKIGPDKKLHAVMLSDAAKQTISFSDEMMLPVGCYHINLAWLTLTDKDGKEWQLRTFFGDKSKKKQFDIKEGETVTINPGPPFTILSSITRYSDRLRIGIDLVGNEGETYGLRLDRNARPPTLRIVDEKDAEIHSGTMEYG